MQQIYAEPIRAELITARIREIKAAGVVACGSLTPQRTAQYAKALIDAELDLFVIQGTVVSAEHVSKTVEPLISSVSSASSKSQSSSAGAPPTRRPCT